MLGSTLDLVGVLRLPVPAAAKVALGQLTPNIRIAATARSMALRRRVPRLFAEPRRAVHPRAFNKRNDRRASRHLALGASRRAEIRKGTTG